MIKINKILLGLAVVSGFFSSCEKEDALSKDLSLDIESVEVGPEQIYKEIKVTSGTSWLASSSTPWISVSPANANGSATCVLNIDSTLSYTKRSAQVRFAPEGREPKMLTVTQWGFAKQIEFDKANNEIESTELYDKRHLEVKITSNVEFVICDDIEYSLEEAVQEGDNLSESDINGWIVLPPVRKRPQVSLDKLSRPRSVKLKMDWKMNTIPYTRIAKIKLKPLHSEDQLVDDEGNNIDYAYITVKQKPSVRIEDNRSGDSISVVVINQKMESMFPLDVSENMQNWTEVTLWEEGDTLPEPAALGRIRSLVLRMVNTKESIPQEIKNIRFLESLNIEFNSNSQGRDIKLQSDVCTLKYLKKLHLVGLGLVSLPSDFGKLGATLEELSLQSNNFASLSDIVTTVNQENFPKLKTLILTGCRRSDSLVELDQMESGNKWRGKPIGLYIKLFDDTDRELFIDKLLGWHTLENLRMSYGFMEGNLPTDEEMMNKFGNYADYKSKHPEAPVCVLLQDTCKWLLDQDGQRMIEYKYDKAPSAVVKTYGSDVPCVLPNAKTFFINLNFLTGDLPKWITFHPHFYDWMPESLVYNQQETGKNSKGENVGFDNLPLNLEYYYGNGSKDPEKLKKVAYPLYYNKYWLISSDDE